MKTLHQTERVDSQSTHVELIATEQGHKLRATVHFDSSYAHQAWAKVETWLDGQGWSVVATATPAELGCVYGSGATAAHTRLSTTQGAARKLVTLAAKILAA